MCIRDRVGKLLYRDEMQRRPLRFRQRKEGVAQLREANRMVLVRRDGGFGDFRRGVMAALL